MSLLTLKSLKGVAPLSARFALLFFAALSLSACKEATPLTVQGVAVAPIQRASFTHYPPTKASAAAEEASSAVEAGTLQWPSVTQLSTLAQQGNADTIPTAEVVGHPSSGSQSEATQAPQEAGGAAYQAPLNYPGAGGGQRPPHGKAPNAAPHAGQVHQAPSSQPQGAPAGKLRGIISLAPELQEKVPNGAVLFIIVRRDAGPGQRGTLIAATKSDQVNAGTFPFPFVVTQADAMMGAPLAGKVRISARIDADGDALSKNPGDLIGEASEAAEVNGAPVRFTISRSL
ncbi:MAG: hypothetical protein VYD19_06475 [Myxococcota bacterium]|nr:hypothetical protein [Myxococcota bacterium]